MEENIEKKPGAMALIAIKNQNNQKKSAVVFKKPAEPVVVRKKTKNVILTEEKYMEVSFLCERFEKFSHLMKLFF